MISFKRFLLEENVISSTDVPNSERMFLISSFPVNNEGNIIVKDDLHNDSFEVAYNIRNTPWNDGNYMLIVKGEKPKYAQFRITHPNTGKRMVGHKREKGVGGKKDLQYKPGWTDDHIVFGTKQDHSDWRVIRIPFSSILSKLESGEEKDFSKETKFNKDLKSLLLSLIRRGNDAMNLLEHEGNKKALERYLVQKYQDKEKAKEARELIAIPSKKEIKDAISKKYGIQIDNWEQISGSANKALSEIYPYFIVSVDKDKNILETPKKFKISSVPEFWIGKDRGVETNKSFFLTKTFHEKEGVSIGIEPINQWRQTQKRE